MSNLFVVIPAYNAERYLQEAVESVLKQPCRCNVVLVNDGSTDNTADICDKIAIADKRVSVIHQKNSGVSRARNRGIAYILEQYKDVPGYIGFCDAYDLWKAGCVTQAILNDAESQSADVVGFSCWCTDQTAKRYYVYSKYQTGTKKIQGNSITEGVLEGPFCTHLYSVAMLKRYMLRFPESVSRNEDVIFMKKVVFVASSFLFQEDVLYLYRTNRESATHQTSNLTKVMVDTCRAWYIEKDWDNEHQLSLQQKEVWYRSCLLSAAAILLETARLMSEAGIKRKYIWDTIWNEPYFAEIDNLVVENLAYWQQPDLIIFRRSFNLFYWKFRILGMVKQIGKMALRLPVIRKKRETMKFPFEMSQ